MDYITEFRSILVTNIYATDPTNPTPRRPIRCDHHGSGIYTGTAEDFLKVGSYRKYTRDFIARLPGLAKDLALIDATFNPIQQYLKDVLAGVK
jgi:hypothetical protein